MTEQIHKLAAIMFTDIVGYTTLMGKDSNKALELIRLSKEIEKPLVEKYNGKWIKEMGDGSLSSFSSALDAVNCAIEIQESARAKLEGKLRIGIHLGDVTIARDDVYGDGVNVASRLESIADPGGIYISESIEKAIRGQSEVQAKYLGELKLKNVAYGVRTYALQGNGLPAPRVKLTMKGQGIFRGGWAYIIVAIAAIIVSALAYLYFNQKKQASTEAAKAKTIAVLPFKNLSSDPETQYFVDGIMDVVLTNLTRIGDLQVTSRTSVEKYREGNASVKEIAKALDVNYLVEASVQRFDNQIKVVVQLIDANQDRHLWAETYDAEWQDVLKLQSELSQNIAENLNATITDPEIKMIRTAHETDPLAQDYLFKGRSFLGRSIGARQDLEWGKQMVEKAIAIDSNYALAWVQLGAIERRIYHYGYNVSAAQKKKVKQAYDRAYLLRPDLMETQRGRANYLYGIEGDYPKALQLYEQMASQYPQNAGLKLWIGLTHRRMGNFDKAEQFFKEFVALRPTRVSGWYTYGQIENRLRKYSEAERAFSMAITLNPSFAEAYQELAEVQIDMDGDLHRARETLNQPFLQGYWNIYVGLALRERNFKRAIELWQSAPEEGLVGHVHFVPKSLGLALVYYMAGNDSAQVLFRESIDPILSEVEETPEDKRLYASLGLAYAGLDERQKAMESVERLDGFRNRTPNALGPNIEHRMIRIYIMLQEFDPVMKLIKKHLDGPYSSNNFGSCTINDLKLHPMYDPLRELPEFQAILENPKYQIVD